MLMWAIPPMTACVWTESNCARRWSAKEPIWALRRQGASPTHCTAGGSTRTSSTIVRASIVPTMRSEEHTSELQSLMRISYAVFCLKNNNESQNINVHALEPKRKSHTVRQTYSYTDTSTTLDLYVYQID